MSTLRQVLLVASIFTLSGCLPDTGGIEPPIDQLIFPVGLATTPNDDHLLVVNSNFDLEYNSGTLVDMDLSLVGQYLSQDELSGPVLNYACGEDGVSEVSADGEYCFIYDHYLIREQETINVGAFASSLSITPAGDVAMVPVRGERAVLLVEVDDDGDDVLSCAENEERKCDTAHRVEASDNHTLPIEPYEVAAMDYTNPDGTVVTLGFSTHLAGGEVSLFHVADAVPMADGGVGSSQISAELMSVLGGVVEGASGVAVNQAKQEVYVAGRDNPSPHVAVLEVITDEETGDYSQSPWFNQTGRVDLSDDLYGGSDARGLAVTEDGTRGYLLTRTPDALLSLNLDSYAMNDMVSVCSDPAVVQLYEDDSDTIDPFDDKVYAFVLCFLTGQVFIVDTDLMQVEVRVTGSGPQAIAFDEKRELAYIANFRESTVTVLQAVPPFAHLLDSEKRIVKLGRPRLPVGND